MKDSRGYGVWLMVLLLAAAGLSGCRTCDIPMPTCTTCRAPSSVDETGEICQVDIPPPPGNLPQYENLVFCGGGVKGAAYGGALQVLDAYGLLAPARNAAGTSAGSISALAVSLGLSGKDVCDLVASINYKAFEDPAPPRCHLESLRTEYGWYTGDFATCFLRCLVEERTGSPDTTFAQLHERAEAQRASGRCGTPDAGGAGTDYCFKDLSVIGTDVSRHAIKIFSYQTTPDIQLAEAVRISMAIPIFFTSRELDGSVMVDGGVVWNYPVTLFDDPPPDVEAMLLRQSGVNMKTLGFHLGFPAFNQHKIDKLGDFVKELAITLIDAQVAWLMLRPDDIERTVFIDTGDISSTDFDLTPAQLKELVTNGADATKAYLGTGRGTHTAPRWLLKRLLAWQPQTGRIGSKE